MKKPLFYSDATLRSLKGRSWFPELRFRPLTSQRPRPEEPTASSRQEVIDRLCRERALGDELRSRAREPKDVLPPASEINDQLSRMGEPWRVHCVDGYRYEFYDV